MYTLLHNHHPFSRAAPTYETHAFVQKEMASDLLKMLDCLKLNPALIGDLGAGTGLLTRALKKRYNHADIFGVDMSKAMLMIASKKHQDHLYWVLNEAASLCFHSDTFDLLVSNAMLQWCSDARTVLKESLRVLKPGSAFLFSTFGPNTLQELRHSWAAAQQKSMAPRFADMHLLGDALLEAGFCDPVMDTRTLTIEYPSAVMLMHDLKGIGANHWPGDSLNGLMSRGLFQRVIHHYNQWRTPAGKIPATYEIIYGLAWKPAV